MGIVYQNCLIQKICEQNVGGKYEGSLNVRGYL